MKREEFYAKKDSTSAIRMTGRWFFKNKEKGTPRLKSHMYRYSIMGSKAANVLYQYDTRMAALRTP